MRQNYSGLYTFIAAVSFFSSFLFAGSGYYHGDWIKVKYGNFPDPFWVQILDRTKVEKEEVRGGEDSKNADLTEIESGTQVILRRGLGGQTIAMAGTSKFRAITAFREMSRGGKGFQTYRQFAIDFSSGNQMFSLSTTVRNERTLYVSLPDVMEYRFETHDQFLLSDDESKKAMFTIIQHFSIKNVIEDKLNEPVYLHSIYKGYNYATAFEGDSGLSFARLMQRDGVVSHAKDKTPAKYTFELGANKQTVRIKNKQGNYLTVGDANDQADVPVSFVDKSADEQGGLQWQMVPLDDVLHARYRDTTQMLVHLRHRKTGRYLSDIGAEDDSVLLTGYGSYQTAGIFTMMTEDKPASFIVPESVTKKESKPFTPEPKELPDLMASDQQLRLQHGDFIVIRDAQAKEMRFGSLGWTQIKLARVKGEEGQESKISNGSQVELTRMVRPHENEIWLATEGFKRKAAKYFTYRTFTINFDDGQGDVVFTLSVTKKNGKTYYVTAPREISTTLHSYTAFVERFADNPYFQDVDRFSLTEDKSQALKFGVEKHFSAREYISNFGKSAYIYSLDDDEPKAYLYQDRDELKGAYLSDGDAKLQQFKVKRVRRGIFFEIEGKDDMVLSVAENRDPVLISRDSEQAQDPQQIRWTVTPNAWDKRVMIEHQATGTYLRAFALVPSRDGESKGSYAHLSKEKM